jgi:para-aminobenzoate synthetase component 1
LPRLKNRATYTLKGKITSQLFNQALVYGQHYTYFIALQNWGIESFYGSFQPTIAWGRRAFRPKSGKSWFSSLEETFTDHPRYLFGYLGYDLKNEIYDLSSRLPDINPFPEACLFEPETLISFQENVLIIETEADPDEVWQAIQKPCSLVPKSTNPLNFVAQTSKLEFLKKIEQVKNHILEGDCYELNLCQEFLASEVELDPVQLFLKLGIVSPAPFSAFFKLDTQYIISASPERFLKKTGNQLISQPIKGTAARSADPIQDEQLKAQLQSSEKERAENMMIVDLVRNDLGRTAVPGSVQVPELFKIYSFPQVHQMISTVTSQLTENTHFIKALKWAFPMGSMTGAPKKKVMELIDKYEDTRRGPYSGALGYISPQGDFDFNVLIRTLFYSETSQKLSFQVGGAITWDSDPEQEYQECLTKAQGLLNALNARIQK